MDLKQDAPLFDAAGAHNAISDFLDRLSEMGSEYVGMCAVCRREDDYVVTGGTGSDEASFLQLIATLMHTMSVQFRWSHEDLLSFLDALGLVLQDVPEECGVRQAALPLS